MPKRWAPSGISRPSGTYTSCPQTRLPVATPPVPWHPQRSLSGDIEIIAEDSRPMGWIPLGIPRPRGTASDQAVCHNPACATPSLAGTWSPLHQNPQVRGHDFRRDCSLQPCLCQANPGRHLPMIWRSMPRIVSARDGLCHAIPGRYSGVMQGSYLRLAGLPRPADTASDETAHCNHACTVASHCRRSP